jgi:alpha/beta superfamily hydrolase
MHNNVVRGLSEGLARRGLPAVRFDYRGVGRSEGAAPDVPAQLAEFWQTSHAAGELELWQDVQAAADFARRATGPGDPLVLVGYSFGCALLPRVHVADAPLAQVLVAPTVAKHDYEPFLGHCRPTLVIAAPDDFAADPARLRTWFDRLAEPKQLVLRPGDSHFFRGYEDWLAETAWTFLSAALETPA